jgi:DNA polymerase
MNCPVQKDSVGKNAMLRSCKPRNAKSPSGACTEFTPKSGQPSLVWYTRESDPSTFATLDAYCVDDVLAEVELKKALPDMRPGERRLATLDREVNSRGIPVDMDSVHVALELTSFIKSDGDARLSQLTGGAVPSATKLPALKAWLASRGTVMDSVTKSSIPEVLAQEDLPEDVRAVLSLRLEGGAASLKKLDKMRDQAGQDGVLRDQFQYSGSHTGRWAGRGVQPQNIFRGWDCPEKQETFFRLLNQDKSVADIASDIRDEFGDLAEACKNALRGFIKAPEGYSLYVCDFSGIENRVLAWLADEQPLLDAFRRDEDPYVLTAAGIYGVEVSEVTKSQRAMGKVAVLAAQFGQGPTGFQATCKAPWGIDISLKEARKTIKSYRDSNPAIKAFWYDLYRAAMSSVMSGDSYPVGKLTTHYDGQSLQIELPSGRRLHYWRPVVQQVAAPWSWWEVRLSFDPTDEQVEEWGISQMENSPGIWKARECDNVFWSEVDASKIQKGSYHEKLCYQLYHEQTSAQGAKKWCHIRDGVVNPRQHGTWHGTLAENVTQAVARDALAEATMRVDQKFFAGDLDNGTAGVIGYVHDEIIALVPDSVAGGHDAGYAEYERIMLQTPSWAAGLPISGEGYYATRYRK